MIDLSKLKTYKDAQVCIFDDVSSKESGFKNELFILISDDKKGFYLNPDYNWNVEQDLFGNIKLIVSEK